MAIDFLMPTLSPTLEKGNLVKWLRACEPRRARDGGVLPRDYQGRTASLSNVGMFGISETFPVINPPQAMILGIAAGARRPFVVGNAVALATVTATASFDHRSLDGAVGARFMTTFRTLIEAPMNIIA